jgi:hypothetical protein
VNRTPHTLFEAFLALGVLLVFLLQGCSTSGQAEQPDSTLAALSASVAGTATAAQVNADSSNTLATAQVEATSRSQDIFATQTAQDIDQGEAQLATATATAPILAELSLYGLDAASGHTGWVHDPLTLELTAFHDYAYGNDFMNVTASDFVLAADITWDTQYGGSGCGFMFRSNGDQNKPSQYMVIATRFSNGRVIFSALADGELANLRDFYPSDEDRSFEWQNGTTNRLAVVARGDQIEIYTNHVKIGELDTTQAPKLPALPAKPVPPLDQGDLAALQRYQAQLKEYDEITQQIQANYQTATKNFKSGNAVYDDGFLAMLALSQSGHTICKFENAWLWLLEP